MNKKVWKIITNVLEEKGKQSFNYLWEKVKSEEETSDLNFGDMSKTYLEISTSKNFVRLEDNVFDLRKNYKYKDISSSANNVYSEEEKPKENFDKDIVDKK